MQSDHPGIFHCFALPLTSSPVAVILECQLLALPTGGALVAIEAPIDDARRENIFGLLMSLNMLIEFGDAFDYSGSDFRKWCGGVGFKRFEVIHLAGASSAAIAYK